MSTLDLMSSLVTDTGKTWGSVATRWQLKDARAILNGQRHYAYITRPRGGSKTSDVAGASISVLLEQLPPGGRGHAFAGSRDQAGLLLDAAEGFIRRTPQLHQHLEINNNRIINKHNRASIEVMSADGNTSYGIRSHWLVVDELAAWADTPNTERLWTAIVSAAPKIPGCRLIIISNAGHPSSLAGNVLRSAKESTAWYVSETAGPLPWIDPDQLDQQKRLLTDATYRRLHLNQWTTADDSLATLNDIEQLVTLNGPTPPQPDTRYAVTVDLGLVKDRTVIAVTHVENETVVLDLMETWTGTKRKPVTLSEVEDTIHQTHRNYNRAVVVYDPSQAQHLMQRLRDKGVHVEQHNFTTASNHQIATALHQAVRHAQLALYDAPGLVDELSHVRLIETNTDRYRLDHDPSRHDDRAVTLAMAVHHWNQQRRPRTLDQQAGLALAWTNASLSRPAPWSV